METISVTDILLVISIFLILILVYKSEKHSWPDAAFGPVGTTIIGMIIPYVLVRLGFIATIQHDNMPAAVLYATSVFVFAMPVCVMRWMKIGENRLRHETDKTSASTILITASLMEMGSSIYYAIVIIGYGFESAMASHADFYNQLADQSAFLEHSLPVRFMLNTLGYSGLIVSVCLYFYGRKANVTARRLAVAAVGLFTLKSIIITGRGLFVSTFGVIALLIWRRVSWKYLAWTFAFITTIFILASFVRFSGFSESLSDNTENQQAIAGVRYCDWIENEKIKGFAKTTILYFGHSYVNFSHYVDLFSDGPRVGGIYAIRGLSSVIGAFYPETIDAKMEAFRFQNNELAKIDYLSTQWSTFPGGYLRDFGPFAMVVIMHIYGWVYAFISCNLNNVKHPLAGLFKGMIFFFGLSSMMFAPTGFYLGSISIIVALLLILQQSGNIRRYRNAL